MELGAMNVLKKFFSKPAGKLSYAQCGEDVIVDFIFETLFRISRPSYLDIGAHHPTNLSNTYCFYRKGGQGVCVEADPVLCAEIKRQRPRDVCLNIGVGVTEETSADFFIMSCKTLNTFSRHEAERYQSYGSHKIQTVIKVPLVPINRVIAEHFDVCPNFISIDVEGLDAAIIRSFDFELYRPEVVCVETITYSEDKSEEKIIEIIEMMAAKNYLVFADTYINTIFIDKAAWAKRY
jgi:FkbM family methyltransferase